MTSVTLRLASTWLPEWEVKISLQRISELTDHALSTLIKDRTPVATAGFIPPLKLLAGSIDDRRAAMASNHNVLVHALTKAIGEKQTLELGREALFKVGLKIGEESRIRLRVGDGMDDLIRAARVLYRVLGIHFTVQERDDGVEIEVNRCALSNWYTENTCRVLSATDEGVLRGLNHRVGMRFDRMITSGFPTCIARVWIDEERREA
jgi:hypothetical protein